MPNRDSRDTRDEDSPQYQPGASQYRPQTVESDEEVNREMASEYDDRIDPDSSDATPTATIEEDNDPDNPKGRAARNR